MVGLAWSAFGSLTPSTTRATSAAVVGVAEEQRWARYESCRSQDLSCCSNYMTVPTTYEHATSKMSQDSKLHCTAFAACCIRATVKSVVV